MSDDHRAEFDQLAGQLVELASRFVEELGGFAPFGGCVDADGKIIHLGVDEAVEDPADAIELLAKQIRTFGSHIGMILVDTRITDPRTSHKTDSIMFIGESRHGFGMRGFLPYAKTGEQVTFGEHFMMPPGPPTIFAAQE